MVVAIPGLGSLLTLSGVWAVALASPGPDFFLITNRGVTRGFSSALSAAVGVVLGIEAWMLITLIGLGAVLVEFPQTRTILSVLGGAYLLYLAWQSVRAARFRSPDDAPQPETATQGRRTDFVSGLMTNLGNPKALIFFGTLLIRFIPEGSGFFAHFAVWSTMTVMACLWFGTLCLLASRKSLQSWLSSKLNLVNSATGVIFIALGLIMIYEGVPWHA
jgi:threonine efflux protein